MNVVSMNYFIVRDEHRVHSAIPWFYSILTLFIFSVFRLTQRWPMWVSSLLDLVNVLLLTFAVVYQAVVLLRLSVLWRYPQVIFPLHIPQMLPHCQMLDNVIAHTIRDYKEDSTLSLGYSQCTLSYFFCSTIYLLFYLLLIICKLVLLLILIILIRLCICSKLI